MTKLMYIEASPRGGEAASTKVAEAYLTAIRSSNPDLSVDVYKLWSEQLPDFDGDKVGAKMQILMGQEQDAAQKTLWQEITAIAQRFAGADRYVFAVPMWNAGIPYRLKQYIDVIHQPAITFGINENGYFGLLKNKHATLILSAGAFAADRPSPDFGVDHQSTYLRAWLNQAGISEIDEVRHQPSFRSDGPHTIEAAKQRAVELASKHGRL